MTLTLEDVKNVRFPIAKRQGEGYRATEVDDFVDAVDATFTQFSEENERLKAQLSAMDAGTTRQGAPVADPAVVAENERLKAEIAELRNRPAPVVASAPVANNDAELNRLRSENQSLRGQLDGVRRELEAAKAEAAQSRQSAPLGVVENGERGRVERIVVTTSAQAAPALVRMVQLHTEQAEAVVEEAEAEAKRKVAEAERRVNELTLDAQTRAEKIQSEARVNADQMTTDARTQAEQVTSAAKAEADRLAAEARANADRVNADADNRRRELFSGLEFERDQLIGKVDALRSFESNFRSNLVSHLRSSIEHVEKAEIAPREVPALLGDERPSQSATPRLDALRAEGQQN